MRPLAVLALIVAAIAALLFAYFSISDSSGRSEAVADRVVKPAEFGLKETTELVQAPEVEVGRTELEIEGMPIEDPGGWDNKVFGVVRSPAGVPVPKAQVSVFRKKAPAGFNAIAAMFDTSGENTKPMRTTHTDGEGKYIIKGLKPGRDCLIVVDHDDYQREEVGPIHISEDGSLREDIQLQEGYKIFGYVTDHATGAKIVGAQLWIDNPLSAQLPSNKVSPDRMATESLEDGRYEFAHISPGSKWLVCKSEGYGTVMLQNLLMQNAERYLSKDISMKPELTISGIVIGPDRQGIEGAVVDAMSYNAETLSRGSTKSGPDGSFTIRGLAEADYSVVARAEGWGDKREVRVVAGKKDLELELAELGGVRGRVVDGETGQALRNFHVSVRMVNLNSTYVGRAVQSKNVRDADNGAFSVSGLVSGHFVVQVKADTYAETRSDRFSITQGLTVNDIIVRMTRGGTIKGIVIDGYTNKPIAGAVVATQDNNWIDSPFTNVFQGPCLAHDDRGHRTDRQGRRLRVRAVDPRGLSDHRQSSQVHGPDDERPSDL